MTNIISERKDDYDPVAEVYAAAFLNELEDKPLDREYLNKFKDLVGKEGMICDLGCGPGQIARHLKSLGLNVIGIDKSKGMVEVARRFNPDIEFFCDDMTELNVGDSAWAGIVNFYAIIHVTPDEIAKVFDEWKRVLVPGGYLLMSFLVGEDIEHVDKLFNQEVDLDFYLFPSDHIIKSLEDSGFEMIDSMERDPYAGVEYNSRRGYIFAKKKD